MSSLRKLAQMISAIADQLEQHKESCGSDGRTESKEWLQTLPKELGQSRLDLIDAIQDLKTQVQSTESCLEDLLFSYANTTSLHIIYALRLPQYIPVTECASYSSIAESCGVNEAVLRRLFHYAMTNRLFTEPKPGYVAHTPMSRLLLSDSDAFDALGMTLEEMMPASHELLAAINKYPKSVEPNETAYNIAHDTNLPLYQFLAKNPERARRFGAGMKYFTRGDHTDLKHVLEAFPWKDYDRDNVLMVDVGGGHGVVTAKIADATSKIRFIVQDLAQAVEVGRSSLPPILKSRVEFMTHDFFQDQVVKHADIYFFRWIMHNWSDKYCLQILRSLTPAMKPRAKVLLYEHVLPDVPNDKPSQKGGMYLDMVMLGCCNGCVRTEKDWQKLFLDADANFTLEGIRRVPGSSLSLIEATWKE
ncbi:putative O-methyltransferase [Lindgomyces ingoldianus]|uniref:O-methyltransferase n=1 Tax=Lindgomyces ingoldianus TaxID=673940 RepID=A0ACB6QGY3_9PLEO|nr:putative O-methyltransferase [Lindgomyces ingoldianus]KAF2466142.1 putative O-methyltransferase [Lindgomyces ingoldianus]